MNAVRSLLLLAFLLVGVHAKAKEPQWFIDNNYLYQKGSELSSLYLKQHTPEFSQKLAEITPWVVRIEIRHGITETGYSSNHGTAVILANGIVATAKHTLTKYVKDLNAPTKIFLTTVSGRVMRAKLVKKGESDWMTLKIDIKDNNDPILKSPVKIAAPMKGETAVFLGYPARLGLDKNGQIQSFHKGNKKQKIPVSQLTALLIVGKVADPAAMGIAPLAGFPPVGGMSGGPIFNLHGEVIAVQHSISKTTEDATGKVLSYRIDAIPTTEIKP